MVSERPTAAPPVYWPSLTANEAHDEWPALRAWVEQLAARYPTRISVPDCWWRHVEVVEPLQALRDYEQGCFASTANSAGAVEWQRSLSDIADVLAEWKARRPCASPGRGHELPSPPTTAPEGWDAFVHADVARRKAEPKSPTNFTSDHTDQSEDT